MLTEFIETAQATAQLARGQERCQYLLTFEQDAATARGEALRARRRKFAHNRRPHSSRSAAIRIAMSLRSLLPDAVDEYVHRVATRETPLQQRLREETAKLPGAGMQIGADLGRAAEHC